MVEISQNSNLQTVITTYEVTPGTCADLLDALQEAFGSFIRLQPGFIAGAIHVNDAQTRIANYTQWQNRDFFLAVLRAEEMRAFSRKFGALSKSFEPVLYDVAASFGKG